MSETGAELPKSDNGGALLERLAAEQVQHWRNGEQILVEAYLAQFPELHKDSDSVFELVYAEFVLRESLGESPGLEEYRRRFPQFAARLERQLDLHQALLHDRPDTVTAWSCSEPHGELEPQPALDGTRVFVPGYQLFGEI